MAQRNNVNGITVEAPTGLRALLATMKSAKAQRVAMSIWDQDIKRVEDAIATIEAIRALNGEQRET